MFPYALLPFLSSFLRAQVLSDVSVGVDLGDTEDFEEEMTVPLDKMPYGNPGQTYVCLKRVEGAIAVGKFANVMRFRVKEVDPSTGEEEEDGYDDEYQLEVIYAA